MRVKHYWSQHLRRFRDGWRYYRNETSLPGHTRRGHFYSPLPDVEEGANHSDVVVVHSPFEGLLGIDLRLASQRQLLDEIVELYPEFSWKEGRTVSRRFYLDQGYYKEADSIVLYALLRLNRPSRVIEIGSGYSSALMLDVNEEFLHGQTHFTFIDPFPERLESVLQEADNGAASILHERVQDVGLETFASLERGDVLFIDSSHISKVGSDLNHIVFNILPLVKPGVLIHFHDVYWPFEYPAASIRQGQAWNEAYLLRAFLLFNRDFEIVFWVPLAAILWRRVIETSMPTYLRNTGAALWLRRM